MGEFEVISEKYYQAGISSDNIEYAVTAVKYGCNPDNILENLKIGYKGLDDEQANALLHDLLIANTFATKRKKRLDFVLGAFYSIVGFICCYYLLHVLIFGGVLRRPIFVILVAVGGIAIGCFHFSKILRANSESLTHGLAHK